MISCNNFVAHAITGNLLENYYFIGLVSGELFAWGNDVENTGSFIMYFFKEFKVY